MDGFAELIERKRQGSLKIYLGYAAGVGKTYAMLQEGLRLKQQHVDVVIGYLNDEREHIVFMLWGDTQKKGAFFDRQRHCVLTASHPAPLSADRRFFGCQHFSKANEYFRSRGLKEIE